MRCCVPFCETDAQNVTESAGITFHEFPSEEHHRAAWLRALGIQNSPLPDSVVCSRHFLNEDICVTECGSRQIRTGAIPSTVQVCMICMDTQSKLFLMSKYKLEGAYEHLLGLPLCDKRNLKQTLCVQCAQRLVNFNKFRDKSLKVHSLMMELVERHELITIQHVKSICKVKSDIVKTVLEPDHYDVCITHSDTLTDTEPHATIESVTVKSEEKDDSMSVDEDRTEQHTVVSIEDNNNADSFNQHSVTFKEEYLTDDSSPSEAMKNRLLITPSTSKQFPELETTVQIKNEITIACTTCLEEFTDENVYLQHTLKHLEDDQNLDEYIISDYPHTSAAGVAPKLETTRRRTVDPSEGAGELDTNDKNLRIGDNASETSQTYQIEIEVDTGVSEIDPLATGHGVDEEIIDVDSVVPLLAPLATDHENKAHPTGSHDRTLRELRKVVPKSDELLAEVASHSDEKPFACRKCEYKSGDKSNFVRHMKTHTGEKPVACELCDYKCTERSMLKRHMRTHTGDKPFACELCDYKSAEGSKLRRHMRTHTGDKPFACELCDYRCITKGSLVQHVRIHTGDKPFACELCEYRCIRSSALITHMKIHTSQKHFSCNLCDYKCIFNSTLLRHMRIHTGEKPFVCELCDYKCTVRSSLVVHMRTHTGQKPFTCELCDYKCTAKSQLASHTRTHTGEKPFACKLCDFKTTRKNALVKHISAHIGE